MLRESFWLIVILEGQKLVKMLQVSGVDNCGPIGQSGLASVGNNEVPTPSWREKPSLFEVGLRPVHTVCKEGHSATREHFVALF